MRGVAIAAFLCLCSCSSFIDIHAHAQAMNAFPSQPQKLQAILDYISSSWTVLERSTSKCEAVADPKLTEVSTLYVPADLAIPDGLEHLPRECNMQVEHLPRIIDGPGQVTR